MVLAPTTTVGLDNGNLLIEDTDGGDTNDTWTLQADSANQQYVISDPSNTIRTSIPGTTGDGTLSVTVPFSAVTGDGLYALGLGGDDTLTVDYSLGAFAKPIYFEGGAQITGNRLSLTGVGSFSDVTHDMSGAASGGVDVAGNARVNYTGTELITDSLVVADRNFLFNSDDNAITLTDAAAANLAVDSTLSSQITFANPSRSLTLNALNGDDTITVASVDAGFRAALTVNGGDENDVVNVNTNLLLGSDTSTGNLSLTAESITLNAATIATDGDTTNSDAGSILLFGPVALGSDVSIDTDSTTDGAVTFGASVNATADGAQSLTVRAGDGTVSYLDVGTTTRLKSLSSAGVNRLGGDIRTDRVAGGSGMIDFIGSAVLTASLTVDSGGTGNGGEINFYNSVISADTPGRDLVLDASPNAGGFGIVLRGFGNSGGTYVNDLTLNAGGNNILNYSNILLDASGTDTGDFTLLGNSGTFVIFASTQTIDTEQGNNGPAGTVDFGSVTCGGGFNSNLTINTSTSSAGHSAGNVVFSNGGGLGRLTVTATGPTTVGDGTVTFNGPVSMVSVGDVIIQVGTVNLPNAASDLSTTGAGTISLTASSRLTLGSGASVTSAGGNQTLVAEAVSIDTSVTPATISADMGSVTLRPFVNGTAIDLGGADVVGTLGLTDAELDRVIAGTINIGNATSGAITVSADLTQPGKNLSLTTGAGVAGSSKLTSGAAMATTITINQAGNSTYSGILGGSGTDENNFALIKTGAGTLTLAGANSYVGMTTVGQGTLRVNNATDSGTGTGPVTVNGTGKLDGTGVIAGTVIVQSGGTVTPGNGTGQLQTGAMTFASGAIFLVELNGTIPGSGFDQLAVNDALNLNNATLTLDVLTVPAVGDRFRIIDNRSDQPVGGTFLGLSQGSFLQVGNRHFQIDYQAGDGDNDVELLAVVTPRVTLTSVDRTVDENVGVLTLTAELDQPLDVDVNMPVVIQSGGAANARDYTLLSTMLTFPAGQTTSRFDIAILDDAADENAESFTVALVPNDGTLLGAVSQNTIAITDNDPTPSVYFSTSSQMGGEGATVVIEVLLTATSSFDVTVPLTFSGDPADYIVTGGSDITIPAGQMRGSTSLSIIDDTTGENTELIQVRLDAPTNAILSTRPGDPLTHVVSISQNDTPSVSFAVANQSRNENAGTVEIEVRLSNSSTSEVRVPLSINNSGTATAGDCTISTSSPLIFAANETSKFIRVTLTDDTLDEPGAKETIIFDLSTPTGAVLGTTKRHVLAIEDNDQSLISFSTGTQEQWEDAGVVNVTVSLSNPSAAETKFRVHVSGKNPSSGYAQLSPGTTLSPADFSVSGIGSPNSQGYVDVVIPSFTSSKVFQVNLSNDLKNETKEKIVLSLDAPVGYSGNGRIGSVSKQEITIKDDDPLVTMSSAKDSITEDNTTVTIKFSLSAATNEDVIVPFSYGKSEPVPKYRYDAFARQFIIIGYWPITIPAPFGTASISDFTTGAEASVLIPAGQTSATTSFSIKEDTLDEDDETVFIKMGEPSGDAQNGGQWKQITILDDDSAPTVSFDTSSTSVGENGQIKFVTLRLSKKSGKDVYVPLSFSGTATKDKDYRVSGLDSSSRLKISAGAETAQFSFETKDDSAYEGNETIVVQINGDPTNASRPSATSDRKRTFTITDNDAKPVPPAPKPAPQPVVRASDVAVDTTGVFVSGTISNASSVQLASVGSAVSYPIGNIALSFGSYGFLEGTTAFFDANFNGTRDFLDLNNDGVQGVDEPDEPSTLTELDGGFALTVGPEFDRDGDELITSTEGRWILAGGTDSSTGLPVRVPLASPLNYFVVTPLTSLMESLVRLHGFTQADAELRLLESFDLTGLSLAQLNLLRGVEAGDANAASAFAVSVKLSNTVLQIADLFAGTPNAPPLTFFADQVYARLAERIFEPGSSLDLSLDAVMADVIAGVATATGITLVSDPTTHDLLVTSAATIISAGNQAVDAVPRTTDLDYAKSVIRIKKVMQGLAAPALHEVTAGNADINDAVSDFSGSNLDAKIAAATVGSVAPARVGVAHAAVREGNNGTTVMEFTVRVAGEHDRDITVNFRTADDVATVGGSDYDAVSGTLTWPAGDNFDRIIQVTVHGDTTFEPDESLAMLLENATNAVIATQQSYGYILNDDVLTFTTPGTGPNQVRLRLDDQTFDLLANDETIAEGFATAPLVAGITGQDDVNDVLLLDFSQDLRRADTITFHGGGGTGIDTAAIRGGNFASITQTLSNPTDGTTRFASLSSDMIVSFDWFGLEPFSIGVSSVDEMIFELPAGVSTAVLEDADPTDADPALVGMMRLRSPSGDFETTVFANPIRSLTIRGGNGTDSITIGDLDPAFFGTIQIDATALGTDGMSVAHTGWTLQGDELIGGFSYHVSSKGNVVPDQVILKVQDLVAKVEFNVGSSSGSEATGGNLPKLLVNGVVRTPQSIDVTIIGGSAADGSDFTLTTTVIIPAGTYDGTLATAVSLPLSITNDDLVELTEDFQLRLTNPGSDLTIADSNTDSSTQDTHFYSITDNDTATFTINDVTVGENGTATFSVSLSNPIDTEVTVDVSYTDDSTEVEDFDHAADSLIFSSGSTEAQSVTVAINDDNIVELAERFVALLTASGHGLRSVVATDIATGMITDNDTAIFTINDVTVAENGMATFIVSLSNPIDTEVTVRVNYFNGSATGSAGGTGADFDNGTDSLTFGANDFASKTVAVGLTDDQIVELDEDFVAALSVLGAGDRSVNANDTGTGTITNNDAPPLSAAYAGSVPTIFLANQPQTFSITLTNTGASIWPAGGPNPVHLGVYFSSSGGTETSGDSLSQPRRVLLSSDVLPGESVNLNVTVQAPAFELGATSLRLRMVKEGVAWFTELLNTKVSVVTGGALSAAYAADVPKVFIANELKTFPVTVTNTGTTTWNAAGADRVNLGVYFSAVDATVSDSLSQPVRFALPADVAPGQSVTLSVNARAPAFESGATTLRLRMVKEGVRWFSELLNSNVSVASGQALSAGYAADVPKVFVANETKAFQVTVTNTGTTTWNAAGTDRINLGVYFSAVDRTESDSLSQPVRFALPADVAPGQSVTLSVNARAPAFESGATTLRLRMVKEGVQWFPDLLKSSVSLVTGQALSAAYFAAPPAIWQANEAKSFSVTLTNTGATTWNAGGANAVHLGAYFNGVSDQAGDWLSEPTRFSLPRDVSPGESVSVTVAIRGPAVAGTYVLRLRMVKELVAWFNELDKETVNVT